MKKIFKNEYLERPENMSNKRCVVLYDTLDAFSERRLEICAKILKEVIDDNFVFNVATSEKNHKVTIEDLFYLLRAYASDRYYQN